MDVYVFSLVTFVLLVSSAFFAASETAITTASEGKMHSLSKKGNKNAKIITDLKNDKNSLISALLFGNNAVNIVASSIVTSFTISYFGKDFVIYSTFIMTIIVIIFAEILPKTYAVHNSLSVSLFVAPPLYLIFKILKPFALVMDVITGFVLRASGGNVNSKMVAVDEIRGAIDLYHHLGNVIKYDRDMLDNILDMSNLEVAHIMKHRKNIYSVNINSSLDNIIEKVLDSRFSRIPVWENNPDNVIGILYIKDLIKMLRTQGNKIHNHSVREFISKPWFIPENTLIRHQLEQFRKQRQHFALIIDEYGDLQGFITLEDILEQIVGNIDDEYDKINPDIFKIADKNYLVSGHVTIREISKELRVDLSDPNANTIAGFVINSLGEIPKKGYSFQLDQFEFKIVGKRNNQITKLLIKVYN